ncbi:MAG: glycosyltransferase [Holophagaceae bacterium]|nr:glycosyltransferase [Holophagaceae bacterium]
MIVKNEAHVIRRCLRSVKPFVDAWVIVDTGSTDGTQDIIREEMKDLPGELHERPWVDFGTNRSEAIRLAGTRWDYLYFIDADEELTLPEHWTRPQLHREAYRVRYINGNIVYERPSLVATRLPWRVAGVLHEYLDCGRDADMESLRGPAVICRPEGARSQDPAKFQKDAAVFEKALAEDPTNARNRFYLAQSYRDAGNLAAALENYRLRAAMGGWEEEVYIARLNAARLAEGLKLPQPEVIRAYLEAHNARPHRAEALVELARYHRERSEWPLAYLFARAALQAHPGDDLLFVEPAAHQWRAQDECAVAAYWTGRHEEVRAICEALLTLPELPEAERPRVLANLNFSLQALGLAPRPA